MLGHGHGGRLWNALRPNGHENMTIYGIVDVALQVLAAIASIGRVYTPHRITGRRWNAVALLSIAIDYSIDDVHIGENIYVTGTLVFWSLSIRTAIILVFNLDRPGYWRKLSRALIAGMAWLSCAVIVILNQYQAGGFDPKTVVAIEQLLTASLEFNDVWYLVQHVIDPTVIALAGLGLGCLGEAMGDMVRTRRCVFAMGVLMAGFAMATHNWGQLFKNLVSDVAATTISAIEFRDPPWENWFPHIIAKFSAGIRRFRSQGVTMRSSLRTGSDSP